MLIFLYGQDTYRSRQKLDEIIESYQKIHKSGLNLKYFDFDMPKLDEIKNEIQTVSMFKEKKLIVLKNVFSGQEQEEKLLDLLKKDKNSEDIILIYEGKEIEGKSSLFVFLKKIDKSQHFELLEWQKLKNWAKREFGKYQAEIDLKALEKFIDFTGNNLWLASNEIKKLANYKAKQKIEMKDIELLVKPKIAPAIFKTIDAIASKNKKQALELLHGHLEKGDSPLYLLSMINFQLRNLLVIKDLSEKYKSPYLLSKKTQLHPFVVRKSYFQAQKFTIEELKKIYHKLFEVDLAIKTGRIEPQTALDLLIIEV